MHADTTAGLLEQLRWILSTGILKRQVLLAGLFTVHDKYLLAF